MKTGYHFLPSSKRIWIIGLMLLWALFLFGGFLFGAPDASYSHRMPIWTRMVSSFTLVVAGWSWFVFSRGQQVNRYALLIALGMTFGFLGDMFLASVLPAPDRVLTGMASFAVGHIFYILALTGLSRRLHLGAPLPRWGMLALWWLVGLAGWFFVVFRGQDVTIIHWVALPYALLLASTAGLGSGLAVQDRRFVALALGGALFLLSDLILAGDMFSDLYFRLIGDVVWLTYGPAQMLIVYSIGAAWNQAKAHSPAIHGGPG
ncbi:MAG: lysoplasmalogenase [Chloroflexi bacterium]|nr:lysoplasmalogenase [Chloroflexota bacterium]MBP6805175.1 lysoplasmalogenase [Chloroflexota bacterium]